MSYTSVDKIKAQLKQTSSSDDPLLVDYVAFAQRVIEAPVPLGTGRVFEAASDTTKYFDVPGRGENTAVLDLRNQDLCSITSITNGNGTVIPSTAYVTRPRDTPPYYAIQLRQMAGYAWTWSSDGPEGAIAIVGKWGYSTAAPADIARCALRIAIWCYRSRDNAGFDMDIKTEEGLILAAKMPRDIREIIRAYWGLT